MVTTTPPPDTANIRQMSEKKYIQPLHDKNPNQLINLAAIREMHSAPVYNCFYCGIDTQFPTFSDVASFEQLTLGLLDIEYTHFYHVECKRKHERTNYPVQNLHKRVLSASNVHPYADTLETILNNPRKPSSPRRVSSAAADLSATLKRLDYLQNRPNKPL